MSSGIGAKAQDIVTFEGLPPIPPNVPTVENNVSSGNENEAIRLEPLSVPMKDTQPIPQPPALNREYIFEAPVPSAASGNNVIPDQRLPITQHKYLVQVASASDKVLSAVKEVEPQAYMRGDRLIQAGVFSDQVNAQKRISELQKKGIPANVVELSPEGSTSSDHGYFVVVPSFGRPLSEVNSLVQKAGIHAYLIQERTAPRGPHVAVGPFPSRSEANLWNSQIRAKGLDSRLYFHK